MQGPPRRLPTDSRGEQRRTAKGAAQCRGTGDGGIVIFNANMKTMQVINGSVALIKVKINVDVISFFRGGELIKRS